MGVADLPAVLFAYPDNIPVRRSQLQAIGVYGPDELIELPRKHFRQFAALDDKAQLRVQVQGPRVQVERSTNTCSRSTMNALAWRLAPEDPKRSRS